MAQDQPFPVPNYFSDFIQPPASRTRAANLMCIPTSKSVTCPKCNIISHFKGELLFSEDEIISVFAFGKIVDVMPSIFMEEMIKIFKEADSSLRDITRELVSGNVSSATENSSTSKPDERKNLVLLGCALNPNETDMLMKFATQNSAITNQFWRENVTHVVISTDNSSTFRREFKFLMAILFGKWVVSIEWINACLQKGRLMPEEPYEVNHDLHGSFDGPKKGRIRVNNKAPKLFAGLGFFLSSYLEPLIRARLEEVLVAAGGTIIKKEDLHLPPAALGDESLEKYIVINEEEPLSSGDMDKTKLERSEEMFEFCKRTESPRFVGYTNIADAIAALDSGILNKEYVRVWELICNEVCITN
ncbi:protein BREAST CANCER SUSCEPTIBILITY 1 [Carex littledalei]|uniref:Protein BREAST CANCER SUSCEPTIBILITY 1 n=1 Tax=Carex littledalei TaxID=544730 RepID=A0A833VCP6_9POAL|nr:protein BREAST CANCER SUSCEPTIBILITY 1 [Carex littledalei]